ncbi:MAG: Crp/Fnr family transcriptional regulator [Solirubrobacteraceae bacterium]
MTPFFERAFADMERVRLLEEDPQLFGEVSPAARRDARVRAVVSALSLPRGPWDGGVPGAGDATGYLGLLVLEGTMIRNVRVARHPRSELVGRGDLARPWEHDGAAASMPCEAGWQVLEPTRLAVLDDRFLATACRWPAVMSAILGRAVRRSHGLALQLAITDVRHIKPRLLLLFWHLADRWGRVGRDGVSIPIPLTHEVVAQLVGAQRPTVSTALQALSREGLLTRRTDRTWLLDPRSAHPDARGSMFRSARNGSAVVAGPGTRT